MMNKYIIEFLGTLFLTFIVLATGGNYLAIGAALSVSVLLGGSIYEAAYNPAITLAYVAAGKIPMNDVVPYIVAEIAGALAALQLVKVVKM